MSTAGVLALLITVIGLGLARLGPHLDRTTEAAEPNRGAGRPAAQNRRSALVIGNAAYETKPLRNPRNDARAVARVLQELGFEYVEKLEDLKTKDLGPAIERFIERVRMEGGIAVLYYSGHGIELEGENYIIPVDLNLSEERNLRYGGAVQLNHVLAGLERSNGPNIVILDACRNNPFPSTLRNVGIGLGRTLAPSGSLVAYAAAPGQVASDGQGDLGTFTRALVRHLARPDLEVRDVLLEARQEVEEETRNRGFRQVPWDSSSLMSRVFLGKGQPAPRKQRKSIPVETPSVEAPPSPPGMVFVPAGEFLLGCVAGDGDCEDDEPKPARVVRLPGFFIDETEVTVDAYSACVRDVVCERPRSSVNWGRPRRGDHPIDGVSYADAETYCAWKNKRLPTEVEWEKAARGKTKNIYPWGNEPPTCARAVLDDGRTTASSGASTAGCGRNGTWPVGSKPDGRSPSRALDLAGNVWEWTATWYDAAHTYRVIRGGSWYGDRRSARASSRGKAEPSFRTETLGFRCVLPDGH